MKKHGKRILSILLSLILLLSAAPLAAFADSSEPGDMQAGIISDIHYYSKTLIGDPNTEEFKNYCSAQGRQLDRSENLLDSALTALAEHAKQNGLKYVLIPGDLSNNGEYAAHKDLAAQLEQFEKDTGIKVFAVPGNHDINNSSAASFVNNKKEPARTTSPEEFREIYKNLGFDEAYHTYAPPKGAKSGMLSYSAQLDGGYRLIAIDSAKYSADCTKDGANDNETSGQISPDLLKWVLNEIKDAKNKGETPVGMLHHNLVPHMDLEATILQSFVLDDYLEMSETLADAGMHFAVTGHFHMNDCALNVSDNGEPLYDIATAALTSFPNNFREIRFSSGRDGKVTADIKTYDVDCVKPVTVNGAETPKPYKKYSFDYTYKNGDPKEYVNSMAKGWIAPLFKDIENAGGLEKYLLSKDIDLSKTFNDLLNGGVYVAGQPIFTSKNIMSFVSDLLKQVDETYINDIDYTMSVLEPVINKVIDLKMSDKPCTKYIEEYGFGSETEPGDFGDLLLSIMAYYMQGDEDISDDAFIKDVIDRMENGDTAERTFKLLLDVLLHDVLEDEILTNLHFNINKLFPAGSLGHLTGEALQVVTAFILKGDTSYKALVDFIFGLGVLPYDSIDALLNHYMDEYLTDSQYESIGHTMADVVDDFCTDFNPSLKKDRNAAFVYDGKMPVNATPDNYRKPSTVTITFGKDSATTRNISWYTKYSVTGTDIEIIPYSDNPKFTGKPTKGFWIDADEEETELQFPGVDFGMFGIMTYKFSAVRHKINLTNLEPGQKYSFRVGDAKHGWWSGAGVIETADNSDKVTFLHMTDMQSQNEKQYKTFANTSKQAFNLFPDAKFIVSTGDHVDSGKNANQWKYLFNTASDTLLKTAFMPAAGNHEKSGDYALDNNFILPDSPEQNAESGRYYSFDYNNVHFMMLNTNNLSEKEGLSEDQMNWLKEDAAKSDAQWKIVALHKAPYSNGSHFDDDDVIQLRKELSVLMPELGIDVVLQGHDHVYMRTGVMNNNQVVNTEIKTIAYGGREYEMKLDPQGSIYVISACAGVKKYNAKPNEETDKLFPRAEAIVNADAPVFSAFSIDGNTLYMDAYRVLCDKTERIDSFAISKADVPAEPTKPTDTTASKETTAAEETTTSAETTDKPDTTKAIDIEDSTSTANPKTTVKSDETERTPISDTGDSTRIIAVLLPMAIACMGIVVTKKRKNN